MALQLMGYYDISCILCGGFSLISLVQKLKENSPSLWCVYCTTGMALQLMGCCVYAEDLA